MPLGPHPVRAGIIRLSGVVLWTGSRIAFDSEVAAWSGNTGVMLITLENMVCV